MKLQRIGALALLTAFALLPAGAARAQLDPKWDPSKLVTPPLGKIKDVKPERFKLKNGIVVFVYEDHDLPVVSGVAYVRTNPVWIPNDKVGLGTVTGEVIRSGGSTAHSGDWLDDRLAAIGASINSSIGVDLANSGFRCLTDNTSEVIGLWAETLRRPALPDDKVELAKVKLRRSIASRNDEMTSVLIRVASEAVYGKGSPYARTPEYATVEAITRADVAELHGRVFEPSRMVIAVYGDFKTADMKKLLAAKFGDWKGAGVALPPLPPPAADAKPRLVFAPKEDVTQSGIIVSHLGFRADDPDYPAMDVLQTALGGGFQSRLVNKIRTERGLAYATGAGAGEDWQRPGVFRAFSLTKSESTMTALDLVRDEVRKVTEAPLTDVELKTAKESVLNQFVFNFETPASVLFRSAYYEVIGYPQDFLARYQQGVEAVGGSSVLEAARRKIRPDQMVAIVVGKEKDFDRPLESAGLPVERVDISIPPPPSKVKAGEATPQALAKGQQLLAKAADFAGGAKAWAAVRSVSLDQDQTMSMQGQTLNLSSSLRWALPDRYSMMMKLPMGEMKTGYDGTAGWRSMMGQVQDQPEMATDVKEQYERSLFRLFGHGSDLEVQALDEPQTVDGVAYQVALVKSPILKDFTLFFAPDGSLGRMEFQGDGPQGPARVTQVFADWQPEGAVKYPRSLKILLDGQPFMDGKATSVKLDAALDPGMFKKPAP